MTWEQIRELHAAGFELGNHTLTHAGVRELSEEEFERMIGERHDEAVVQPTLF